MSKITKRIISVVLCIVTVFSMFAITTVTSSAVNIGYDEPESTGDYAYWNGKKVVRSSSTNVNEVKWMQAALNYCITYKGLNATKLTVDGSFGPASKNATIAFQKKYGLSADGSFGPATIQKMKSVLNPTPSTNNNNSSSSTYNLLWPVPANSGYRVSSRMGTRTAPLPGGSTDHKGIDIAVASGTNIYCTADGTVIDKGCTSARGNYVVVYHSSQNLISIYQHMKYSARVNKGNYVSKGTILGYVGTTGNSTGNHLHFGLVVASSTSRRNVNADQNGTLINPIQGNTNIKYSYK